MRLREQRGKTRRKGTETQRERRDLERRGQSLKGIRAEAGGQIFREKETLMRDTEAGAGMCREAIPTSRRTCRG